MAIPNSARDREATDAALDQKAYEAIGQALKAHYHDLIQAPLPDTFAELLARLEERERLFLSSQPAPSARPDR